MITLACVRRIHATQKIKQNETKEFDKLHNQESV